MGRRDGEILRDNVYPLGAAHHLHSAFSSSKARVKRKLTFIISPSMSIKTDLYEGEAFARTLEALEQMGFLWLARYSRPRMGVRIPRGETVDVGELIAAFEEREITSLPLTGIKATLVHDTKEGIYAKVRVNGYKMTKVYLKITGTIEFTFWDEIKKEVHGRLDEVVEGRSVQLLGRLPDVGHEQ